MKTMDAVKQEIQKALEALGYDTKHFDIVTASHHRLVVFVNGVRLGIYDLDKRTFVD